MHLPSCLQIWFSWLCGPCPVCSSDHGRVNTSTELLPEEQHCSSPGSCRVPLYFHNCTLGITQSLTSCYQMLFASVTKPLLFTLLTHKISPLYPQVLNSQTNSWAIGTRCSVAFHTAFSLTELQILIYGQDSTSFWHLWSVLQTFRNEYKKKFSSTLLICLKLARKIEGCLWYTWTAGLGNFWKATPSLFHSFIFKLYNSGWQGVPSNKECYQCCGCFELTIWCFILCLPNAPSSSSDIPCCAICYWVFIPFSAHTMGFPWFVWPALRLLLSERWQWLCEVHPTVLFYAVPLLPSEQWKGSPRNKLTLTFSDSQSMGHLAMFIYPAEQLSGKVYLRSWAKRFFFLIGVLVLF